MGKKRDAGESAWIDPDDAPELTEEFFEKGEWRIGGRLISRGRPSSDQAKELVSMMIDQDVLKRLRGYGPGWQMVANEVLRAFLDQEAKTGK